MWRFPQYSCAPPPFNRTAKNPLVCTCNGWASVSLRPHLPSLWTGREYSRQGWCKLLLRAFVLQHFTCCHLRMDSWTNIQKGKRKQMSRYFWTCIADIFSFCLVQNCCFNPSTFYFEIQLWLQRTKKIQNTLLYQSQMGVRQRPLNEDRVIKRFLETHSERKRQLMHQWKEFKSLLTFCLCVGDSFNKLLYSGPLQGRLGHVLCLQSKPSSFPLIKRKTWLVKKVLGSQPEF